MAGLSRRRGVHARARSSPVPAPQAQRAGPRPRRADTAGGDDAVRQHHLTRERALVPRRREDRTPHPTVHPLERRGHGDPGQQGGRRHRRPPVDLRLVRGPVRGRVQPLLPGQGRRHPRRPRLLPGSRRPGHLRPVVPRGPPHRGPAGPLPTRGRRPRVCPATPIRGSCPTTGSTRPCRWAWAPSTPSTRPGSCATCRTGTSTTPRPRGSGVSWATARPTSPRPSAPSPWPHARASTT